jgi:hypothetical protein
MNANIMTEPKSTFGGNLIAAIASFFIPVWVNCSREGSSQHLVSSFLVFVYGSFSSAG